MSENTPEPSEKSAPEPEKPAAAKPIAPIPRQAAASGDRAAATPPDSAALNQQLMSALAQALSGQAAPPAPAAKDDRGLISREEKRFRRAGGAGRGETAGETGPEPAGEKPAEPVAEEPKATEALLPAPESPGSDPNPAAEPAEPTSRRPRFSRENTPAVLRPQAPSLRTIWRQMPGGQRGAILAVLAALLAFLGFATGRATAPNPPKALPANGTPRPPVAGAPAAVRSTRLAEPKEIQLIDEAMTAQTSGDYLKAESLLQQLAREAPDIAGNETALALLSMQKGDFAAADYHIMRGIDAGEDAGRLYGLRGMIELRLSHPRRANEAFEMATRSAPHDFKAFFLWGEFLRRVGKTQQALHRFDQAIARVHEQADEDLMQFKRRLTLIAAGRGKELEPEIEQQLALNPPSGDWLLLAMANAAQQDDFKSAAKYLERASQTMSQDALVDRIRDFYLYQWCYQKELEPYFQPLQKRLSAARRAEPVATEAKPGEDESRLSTPAAPEPTKP